MNGNIGLSELYRKIQLIIFLKHNHFLISFFYYYNNKMSGTEILKTIYNPDLFPVTFLEDQSMLEENNLCISDSDITFFREKCQKIELDVPKFKQTLKKILDGPDELLKARAIALIFMLKNVIDISQFFSVILENFKFNRMFFEELKNHHTLMLDVVEEIRDLLHSKAFRTD